MRGPACGPAIPVSEEENGRCVHIAWTACLRIINITLYVRQSDERYIPTYVL